MSLVKSCIGASSKQLVFVAFIFCTYLTIGVGKPLFIESVEKNPAYKDTEEILNEWTNDDSYYEYSDEQEQGPVVKHLPPVLVTLDIPIPETTPATTTTTSSTTSHPPVYFPNTDIELGPLFEQVGKARRKERVEPVDLPVPYIVWAKDPSETGSNTMNYWKKVYNTAYTVE